MPDVVNSNIQNSVGLFLGIGLGMSRSRQAHEISLHVASYLYMSIFWWLGMKNGTQITFRCLDYPACPKWALFCRSQFALSSWECAMYCTDRFNITIKTIS